MGHAPRPPSGPTPEPLESPYTPPARLNIADYFLDDRIREDRGERIALRTERGRLTYREVRELANRFGNLLREAGVRPGQRVMLALPDGPEYVEALFGILKIGAVAVMVNPHLKPDEIAYFYEYTGASVVLVHRDTAGAFRAAAEAASGTRTLLTVGTPELKARRAAAAPELENFPSRHDEAAIWLFSGGTTGRPKAVVQTHASFAHTTECYAKRVIGYREDDITLSVPKLYFGYATGSNLFFPFSVGASAVLFPERCVAEVLFEKIETFRPTILVNVPTMINRLLSAPDAGRRDLSSLRLCTSAGEAFPPDLQRRWLETFGVEVLDGLGTAEMWHIFLSNRPGEARPGTLGCIVPGFDVRVCDDEGRELPDGEVGWLWVRGGARAIGYWRHPEKTRQAFRGEWYVSGDMVVRDAEGYFTYCGRGDDMLKVSGKWLAPREVESCLLEHPAVREVAVVGVPDERGLTKPHAFVILAAAGEGAGAPGTGEGGGAPAASESRGAPAATAVPPEARTRELAEELKAFVRERLAPYKYPREIAFVRELPRSHLGKVDRGALRRMAGA